MDFRAQTSERALGEGGDFECHGKTWWFFRSLLNSLARSSLLPPDTSVACNMLPGHYFPMGMPLSLLSVSFSECSVSHLNLNHDRGVRVLSLTSGDRLAWWDSFLVHSFPSLISKFAVTHRLDFRLLEGVLCLSVYSAARVSSEFRLSNGPETYRVTCTSVIRSTCFILIVLYVHLFYL